MTETFFSDPVNLVVTIIFALGMTVCAVLIPMTIRLNKELKAQNDHRKLLAMQKRWRPSSRQKRVGRKSLKHIPAKSEMTWNALNSTTRRVLETKGKP